MDVEFAHARKGIEGSEEAVSKVHCHTGQPWEINHSADIRIMYLEGGK